MAEASQIARGVLRHLDQSGLVGITEFSLPNGRRADIFAVDDKGVMTIIEIKSSEADFRSDSKWRDYRDYCDQFAFAVAPDFTTDILPEDEGLILADAYGANLVRPYARQALGSARRKSLLIRFARTSARRLRALEDPEGLAQARMR